MRRRSEGTGRANRSDSLHLGGDCELACPVCDCRERASENVDRVLASGGARLVLRGSPAGNPRFADVIRRAREQGVAEIVVRTNALATMEPHAARAFVAMGADAALVPLFSAAPGVHDTIARRPRALAHTLVGMRALAAAGAEIEIEVPLLSPRIQDVRATVALAHRAVPKLRAARFFLPSWRVPRSLAPPRWTEGAPELAGAIRLSRELGVRVALTREDGIPLCALRDHPEVHDAFRFDPKRKAKPIRGAAHLDVCGSCAVRAHCPGVVEPYRAAHGEHGLAPFAARPPAMYSQRTAGSPVFTAEHRRMASKVGMIVLRPTVNCNQDCAFCSANETSGNVWTDARSMFRAITRAAQRGIRRVSFSGGEPTLSPDLPHYVRAASRLGIPIIELVTNAVLLDKKERVERLRAAGLTHAFVSLHAHDERLSQLMTRKVGDHARTVQGIHHLHDAGITTVINHVITSRNHPYLTRFVELVHREFGGETVISFAFVTPQFKVLEDLAQMPRISEVMPQLRRALHRAIELRQPVKVGSRQGIPPCFLGEFRPWSDVLGFDAEPFSEDAPQKQRAEGCESCRYARHCTGLWRPYVAKHGLSELSPVPGGPFTDDELRAIDASRKPSRFGVPMSFEDAPPLLRDVDVEEAGRAWAREAVDAPPIRALPVLGAERSRPMRVLLVGSGRQARRLARAALDVPGISIDGVASPHAPDADLAELGACPRFRSMEEGMDAMRPEAVVVAAATHAHLALARIAAAHRVPALIEKPLAATEADAEEIVRAFDAAGVVLVPAHTMVFPAGVEALFDASDLPCIAFTRRATPSSPDAVRAWSRAALSEVLHHAVSLVSRAAGGGPLEVKAAFPFGGTAPERIRLELAHPRTSIEIALDFTASTDEVSLVRRAAWDREPCRAWRRAGHTTSLRVDGADVPVSRDGSDLARMLAHFRDVALGRAAPLVTAADGLDVLRATREAIAALEAAGAPFERAHAPRHVASPALASFPRRARS